MDDLELLIDFHRDGERQGPGGAAETRRAIEFAGLIGKTDLAIADIGCGSGASTRVLAQTLDAQITAVDLFPQFLEKLNGVSDTITMLTASMDALPFKDASLDAIWSEGAIYNLGFEAGIRDWRRFLKPGGVLAVSELTWFTQKRPQELTQHWQAQYPEVDTAAEKISRLEKHGYALLGYFPLPPSCWLENYYGPMQARFPAFLERHAQSAAAQAIVAAEQAEIALYERYSAYFGYGFYIARKTED